MSTNNKFKYLKCRPSNWTALNFAVKNNDIGTVELLLDAGANIETQDNLGNTPLMYAGLFGYEIILGYLIKRGANVNHKNTYGHTLLVMLSAEIKLNWKDS